MIQYSIVNAGDQRQITVLSADGNLLVADQDHPNFSEILASVVNEDAHSFEIEALFDASAKANTYFERLTDRVTVSNGHVFFDGDPMDNSLTKHIVRFISDGVNDWWPLVSFLENVQNNPSENSKRQLYDWVTRHDLTLDDDGNIIAYKGCKDDGEGQAVSGWAGKAIVDGELVVGNIPNEIGATIEMPRSSVEDNPDAACSSGLHVGTYAYASSYANPYLLTVAVNPRDVVSVPYDGGAEKVRVCRYTVIDITEEEIKSAVYSWEGTDDEDNYEDDDYWT